MALLDSLYDTWARVRQWFEEEANFFRIHLTFFTFTPLIAAGIFYGVNGEYHIRECFLLLLGHARGHMAGTGGWTELTRPLVIGRCTAVVRT